MPETHSQKLASPSEFAGIDPELFRDEVLAGYQPVVFRGLVRDWPAVRHNAHSQKDLLEYLESMDSGKSLYTVVGDPHIDGRLFYDEQLRGVNFQRVGSPFAATLAQLRRFETAPNPPVIAIQAAKIDDAFPGFTEESPMPLLAPDVEPTFWFGNRAIVAPHFDVHDNIACVVTGRRRFTLFPPEQIGNLYAGPILDAPGGVPISMVDIRNPDFARFPRYREALRAAMQVELEPGDALYIPAPWWHAVESTESINLLVNYWFGGMNASGISPKGSLLHSIMSMQGLPAAQREAWGHFFSYYLFSEQDPTAHWPDGILDVVTTMSPDQKRVVISMLQSSLGD